MISLPVLLLGALFLNREQLSGGHGQSYQVKLICKYTNGIWVFKRGEEGAAVCWQRWQHFSGGWGRKEEEGKIKTGVQKTRKVRDVLSACALAQHYPVKRGWSVVFLFIYIYTGVYGGEVIREHLYSSCSFLWMCPSEGLQGCSWIIFTLSCVFTLFYTQCQCSHHPPSFCMNSIRQGGSAAQRFAIRMLSFNVGSFSGPADS